MNLLTKIFRFEAAHAIHSYHGACSQIHGHSYVLHVTVKSKQEENGYIKGLGIIFDFKDLKRLVAGTVDLLDHKLLLSKTYQENSSIHFSSNELMVLDAEPTAENLLVFIRNRIQAELPEPIALYRLTLWETNDSYAEWINS